MPSMYKRLTDYLEYLENSVYSRDEVDSRDFLNFEPKVGVGNNNIVSYNTSGLTFTVTETRIFLGGYSHVVSSLPYTLPASSVSYVYLEKGSGRDDIIISHSTTELQNSFNKIYIARVETDASSIITVDEYSVTPFGSFADYEKMSSFTTTTTITAGSSYDITLSQLDNINTLNKTFLDFTIQYSVFDSQTSTYKYPFAGIEQRISATEDTLTITNNSGSSVDITINIHG